MKKGIEPEDVFFAIAAVIGVGAISLFAVSTILSLVIYLIK
jgi:hypothetical protein